MKKKLIIISVIIILISLLFILKDNKFKLEEKYYLNGEIIQISNKEYNDLINKKESFIVFVHLPGICLFNLPFAPIVEDFSKNNSITIYSLNFKDINDTNLKYKIKYSPSVVLINKGKIVKYLDPNKKEDLRYYKEVNEFSKWVSTYIKIK